MRLLPAASDDADAYFALAFNQKDAAHLLKPASGDRAWRSQPISYS